MPECGWIRSGNRLEAAKRFRLGFWLEKGDQILGQGLGICPRGSRMFLDCLGSLGVRIRVLIFISCLEPAAGHAYTKDACAVAYTLIV